MCKDKSKTNCKDCKGKGMTKECPYFKKKKSCRMCGSVKYDKDMVLIIIDGVELKVCSLCASNHLLTLATNQKETQKTIIFPAIRITKL